MPPCRPRTRRGRAPDAPPQGRTPRARDASPTSPSTEDDDQSSPNALANTHHHGSYQHQTIRIVRSVLHHKLGLPLACYLYSPAVYYRVMEHFPELPAVVHPVAPQRQRQEPRRRRQRQRQQRRLRAEFNDVLSHTGNSWLRGAGESAPQETDLTDNLSKKMDEALQPYQMTVVHNKALENTKSRPDIVVRHASSSGHPVLGIEVGLSNAGWWKKVDQCLMYLVGLRNNEHEFKHPVLLTVLTIESRRRKKKSVFSWARIGTFLATSTKTTPSVVPDFRISLLHRAETMRLRTLSAELGKLMRAACLLPAWASAPSLGDGLRPRPRHEYLGPNCRRVGSVVRTCQARVPRRRSVCRARSC
jgi:hypothetical protein